MHTSPRPQSFGPFPLVQPSHLRSAQPFCELTQDQRLARARMFAAQQRHVDQVLEEQLAKVRDRRFSGAPMTGFGALT
jgi:hypothetical protein